MVRFVVPISRISEAKKIVEQRPDELYLGILHNIRNNSFQVNKRSEFKRANFESLNQVKKLIRIFPSKNISVTMNAPSYTERQIKYLVKVAHKLSLFNIRKIIVADIGFAIQLKKNIKNLELHASTVSCCFNYEHAKFLKSIGFSRVILPRHFSLKELISIKKVKDLEYECIILNSACPNIDGLCEFGHGFPVFDKSLLLKNPKSCIKNSIRNIVFKNYLPACSQMFNIDGKKFRMGWMERDVCGLCNLKELSNSGIKFFKIVGRLNHLNKKITDMKFCKWARMHMYKRTFKMMCKNKFEETYNITCSKSNCYYV